MDIDENTDLFNIKVSFFKRNFEGHRTGPLIPDMPREISANDKQEFLEKIWTFAVDHIEKEVLISGESYSWAAEKPQSLDEIDNFIVLQDKIGKRKHTPSGVSNDLLRSFRTKEMLILIHIYSLNVNSQSVFNKIKKDLIDPAEKDRANAATTERLMDVVNLLKQKHGNRYTAQEFAWTIWASEILRKPQHTHEDLINGHPPTSIISNFSVVPTNAEERLLSIQRGLTVAQGINSTNLENIRTMRASFDRIKLISEDLRAEISDFEIRLQAIELAAGRQSELIQCFEESTSPEETYDSRYLACNIQNIEDMDHAEDD